jgi:hypothetical protein
MLSMDNRRIEKGRPSVLLIVGAFCLACAPGFARQFTSADGKTLEAEFVTATADQVTLKRTSDGQVFTLPKTRFSADDQKWINEQRIPVGGAPGERAGVPSAPSGGTAPKPGAPAKPIEGPFASLVKGDWALSEQGTLKFAFYGGKDLSATEKYPLILTLHGRSKNTDNGKQVGGWMKSFTKPENYTVRPCFILAPMSAQPDAGEGRGWNGK